MAGVPTVRHSVAPNSAPPDALLEQTFTYYSITKKTYTQQNLHIFGFTNELFLLCLYCYSQQESFFFQKKFFLKRYVMKAIVTLVQKKMI